MPRIAPGGARSRRVIACALLLAGAGVLGLVTAAAAVPACNGQGLPDPCYFTPPRDTGTPIGSLKTVHTPEDPQLAPGGPFVADQHVLIQLGKSFFWDQQVGSDGQACASCHFSAGADPRTRNAVSPGLNASPVDTTFSLGGVHAPNSTLSWRELPSHHLSNIDDRTSPLLSDSNDVVGSAGVFNRTFSAVGLERTGGENEKRVPSVPDVCTSVADPDGFSVRGVDVRRVEPRNTPTVIDALFNDRNFWDGRAQDIFNGGSPFGARDPAAYVYRTVSGQVRPTSVRIAFGSLASQAEGPPVSNFEMSCDGRTFPDIGRKLLRLQPLGLQSISPSDSVLGGLASDDRTGLRLGYADLIRTAFNPELWSSNEPVTLAAHTYSQMEANFGLFWGLSVRAYLETLVADNTPVDQFFDGRRSALSDSARRGLNIFQSYAGLAPDPTNPKSSLRVTLSNGAPADARCITCHGGPELTNASIENVQGQRLERMTLRDGACAIYDQGFLTTGVRPARDDPAVAGLDPFNHALAETVLAQQGRLPPLLAGAPQATPPYGLYVTADPNVAGPGLGATANCENGNVLAAFKAPQLRNVELTGPYFHNGGQLTLMQVVDFYNRGGDFDSAQIDENIHSLGLGQRDKVDLVNFLLALTDERVAFEQAPFDHPSLCVANGEVGDSSSVRVGRPLPGDGPAPIAADQVYCIRAVGAAGGETRLRRYLNADPFAH